jgi:monooxygenase
MLWYTFYFCSISITTCTGLMLCGVPNFAVSLGYLTFSWTLRVDVAFSYVCRLLKYMEQHQYKSACALPPEPSMPKKSVFGIFSSTYINRNAAKFYHQGTRYPYTNNTTYYWDWLHFHYSSVNDSCMQFK